MSDQNNLDPQAAVDAVLGGSSNVGATTPVISDFANDRKEEIVTPQEPIASMMSVGENTPLAFVGTAPDQAAAIQATQQTTTPAPEAKTEKPKKKKTGLIVGGILLLLIALGGGVWGYNNTSRMPQIAKLSEQIGDKTSIVRTPGQEKKSQDYFEKTDGKKLNEFGTIVYTDTGIVVPSAHPDLDEGAGVTYNDQDEYEKAMKCPNGYTWDGTDCNPNTDTSSCGRNLDTGAPVCCTNLNSCPGGEIVCEPPARKECKTPVGNNGYKWCTMEANSSWCGGENTGGGGTTTTTVTETIPTMSCTSITKTPTAPVLGNTVTLTCLGAVTPSTAGTLSYKFRYSINGGAYTTLTNTTTDTAELTIAACGTYSVQCQACATLNGVLTCDPTWTGATTN